MLNEKKVRYMTRLAIFEKNEGKKIFPINRYFKSDYVGGQMFRSFFGYTFCFLLILILWIFYSLDMVLGGMGVLEIQRCIKVWGVLYAVGLVIYLCITRAVYSKRYDYASRSQTMYISRLKHLAGRYDGKERSGRSGDRGGRSQ